MKKAVVTIIFLLAVVMRAHSGELSVGVGYPYFSVKYKPVELRYATSDGIKVLAGRFYLYFWDNNSIRGYTGAEGGYLKFDTLEMKGTGYEGSIFIGGECFVAESLSLSVDLAPTYIGLKSEDDYKASGMEIVANISVNYYFSTPTEKSVKSGKRIIDTDKLSEEEKQALVERFTAKAEQYSAEEEYDQATAVWEKVLKIDPENEKAKEEIERIKILYTPEE